MTIRRVLTAGTLTGFVFGTIGFIYIAGNAWFHPETMPLQLTHFLPYPREDTFGAFCFGVALICFFSYQLLREPRR